MSPAPGRITLILGGARSGKSRRALELARPYDAKVFVATAEPSDAEMAERIARHRGERDVSWRTVEAPLDLVGAVVAADAAGGVVLVDCLTLWLSNLLLAGREAEVEGDRLVEAASRLTGDLLLVSNEVGLGLVPETPLGRVFRDAQGRLNQKVAAVAGRVEFVAAGLPLTLKG